MRNPTHRMQYYGLAEREFSSQYIGGQFQMDLIELDGQGWSGWLPERFIIEFIFIQRLADANPLEISSREE